LRCFNKFVDHGGRQGDTAQALAQWRHPVASSEALDVLYRVMRPALYCCIAMAIEIASNLPSFLSSPISLSSTTVEFELKPRRRVVYYYVVSLFVLFGRLPSISAAGERFVKNKMSCRSE
jgi:hypothetical protein